MLRELLFSCGVDFSGDLLRFLHFRPYPTLNKPNVRDWDKFQDWAQQLLGAIKGMGSSDQWPGLLGSAGSNVVVCRRPAPTPNMKDPSIFFDFFAKTLGFVLFPRHSRHPLAAAARLNGEIEAWGWLQEQAR